MGTSVVATRVAGKAVVVTIKEQFQKMMDFISDLSEKISKTDVFM